MYEEIVCQTTLGLNIALIYVDTSKLAVSKLIRFCFCLSSFQCTRVIWLEMYHIKRFIEMKRSPLSMLFLLSCWLDKAGIYSVNYIAIEYSIDHFCIIMKNLSISFQE